MLRQRADQRACEAVQLRPPLNEITLDVLAGPSRTGSTASTPAGAGSPRRRSSVSPLLERSLLSGSPAAEILLPLLVRPVIPPDNLPPLERACRTFSDWLDRFDSSWRRLPAEAEQRIARAARCYRVISSPDCGAMLAGSARLCSRPDLR
jgi:hypothetical protein